MELCAHDYQPEPPGTAFGRVRAATQRAAPTGATKPCSPSRQFRDRPLWTTPARSRLASAAALGERSAVSLGMVPHPPRDEQEPEGEQHQHRHEAVEPERLLGG